MDGRPYTLPALAIRYLRHYLFAQNGKGHGIHSPFVYDFVRNVLMDRTWQSDFEQIEKLRSALVNNSRTINLTDYGAGSGKGLQQKKSIAQIVRSAAKPPRLAQLLYRSVQYVKACTIVELGTSLGLTTAYLSAARKQGNVYSLEGDPAIAAIAIENLAILGITNSEIITGNFDDTLQPLLNRLAQPDLVYIDGNHRLEPTMRYFEQALVKTGEYSVIIFDDIHWSSEMELAWEKIKEHPRVTLTIDLFFLGYVFFRPEFRERQHFTIRF